MTGDAQLDALGCVDAVCVTTPALSDFPRRSGAPSFAPNNITVAARTDLIIQAAALIRFFSGNPPGQLSYIHGQNQ